MIRILAQTKEYVALLLAVLVLIVWGLLYGSLPVSSDKSPVRIVIANGTPAKTIARILDENGLIRSRFVFLLTSRFSGASNKLKPGVYEFNQSMALPEIIGKLVAGATTEVWVTIPEGYTAREIADVLENKQLVDGDAFVAMALEQGLEFAKFPFIAGNNLEGYLFPDTYLISRGSEPKAIIEKMLETFEKKVVIAHRKELLEAIKKRFGLGDDSFPEGLNKLIVLASLVEREAKMSNDRPLIASVLWNRLKKGMRLEVDATVSYVPGESRNNKDRVLYRDLNSNSPYNTYRIYGLPPAPICNPGVASINAVINPAQTDYLFYVAKKRRQPRFQPYVQGTCFCQKCNSSR